MNATVAKYLARWAEPELASLVERLPRYYAALTVPLLGESPQFLAGYVEAAHAARGRVLVIALVNAAADTEPELRARNEKLLRELSQRAERVSAQAWLERTPDFDVLLVDRSSDGFELPRRQGVGLARKIAGDIVLSLFARGALELPFVCMTDADATLPGDYFVRAERERASLAGALVYPFQHVVGEASVVHVATQTYEALLRYHVLGLGFAGSPYAYHSVGSTLAVRAETYAIVRGVPKRAAGEDFYLLDKLAKVAPIRILAGEPVAIASRRSARVPFGTGPRVERILDEDQALVAAPEAFFVLKKLLEGIDRVAAGEAPRVVLQTLEELPQALQAAARVGVHSSGLESAALAAIAEVGQGNLRRRLHTWFDALRTLRFLHALRDAGIPDVALNEALGSAPFCSPRADTLDETLNDLARAERALPCARGPALL